MNYNESAEDYLEAILMLREQLGHKGLVGDIGADKAKIARKLLQFPQPVFF